MSRKRTRQVNKDEATPIGEQFDQAVAELNSTCDDILTKIQEDFQSAYPGKEQEQDYDYTSPGESSAAGVLPAAGEPLEDDWEE